MDRECVRDGSLLEGIGRMSDLWSWGSLMNLTLIGRREMIKSLLCTRPGV